VPKASQREVLFVHGAGDKDEPEGSGRLIAYLQDALGDGYAVRAPAMPAAATDPRYAAWAGRVEQELAAMGDRPILVGHSLGASVLLRWLAEGGYGRPVGGLFLVATPDWGPGGWDYAEFAVPDDFAATLPPIDPIALYHARDDPEVPFTHLSWYAERLPEAMVRELDAGGHSFLGGLPQLADDIRAVR
jgi:predicted alpha/beta hydrolase family esterase